MIQDVKDITSFKWATVTDTSPLEIQLDGDSSPLALVPESLIDPWLLSVGDRVRVELSLRKCVVHGMSGGDVPNTSAGTADLDTLIITGQYHQGTGANATLAKHYPVAGLGGLLVVESSTSGTDFITQTYNTRANGEVPQSFVRTKFDVNAWSLWAPVTNGWERAIPGSISSTGGTATLDTTTGVVTLPVNTTLLRLDGLFEAGYEYEFQLDLGVDSGHSTDNSAWIRMREGGVANSAATHNTAGHYGQYNGVGGVYAAAGTTIAAIGAVSGAGAYVDFNCLLRMRAFALNGMGSKNFVYSVESFTSGSARGVRAGGYTPPATVQFDGIEFWFNAGGTGKARGTIRVYKRKIL